MQGMKVLLYLGGRSGNKESVKRETILLLLFLWGELDKNAIVILKR